MVSMVRINVAVIAIRPRGVSGTSEMWPTPLSRRLNDELFQISNITRKIDIFYVCRKYVPSLKIPHPHPWLTSTPLQESCLTNQVLDTCYAPKGEY